jgi:N-acetyl-anhydromuramyl-L-alanine amidase AmpD
LGTGLLPPAFGSWARDIINNRPVLNLSGAPVLSIDKEGMVMNERVTNERRRTIENGQMNSVKGIIVHQTGGATAQSALNSYKAKHANGAHFLIDKDGTIYQTASINQKTAHVGKLQSRCVLELKCPKPKHNPTKEHRTEMKKSVPDRYPSNEDSIGIELVGQAFPLGTNIPDKNKTYEKVTDVQNNSLSWLIGGLLAALNLPRTEIFRHPVVSRKNLTEASTAKW